MDVQHIQPNLDPNTIQELEALRGKLSSLQETLNNQISYIKEPKYPLTWPDLLNKFNMLTAKFASLSEDFYNYTETGSNATLPKLMLHPFIPTTNEQETNILSILLRTKLIPDIEQLEAETQAAIARELLEPHHHENARNGLDNDEQWIRTRLDQWSDLRHRHDRLAVDAVNFVSDLVNDHRDTFLQRYEEEEEEGEEEEQEQEEQEWEKMDFPSENVWRKWKLECMLNFYSSGKEELVGSDLKKLAVANKAQ
ncbi:hypothetical protein DFQ28_007997 [Apophysomyces sp. BC1034]|nr:hypothetical protein DFQ30_007282 [Apophysomyces sp. BC1015]KAG0182071.1 hypothetical protein DFQ29_005912 [Apophysomyces sp. BC1021]KAG0192753.1 hypothetical protein DFQ28_007997 [Apophysomyces sp. BC1034]